MNPASIYNPSIPQIDLNIPMPGRSLFGSQNPELWKQRLQQYAADPTYRPAGTSPQYAMAIREYINSAGGLGATGQPPAGGLGAPYIPDSAYQQMPIVQQPLGMGALPGGLRGRMLQSVMQGWATPAPLPRGNGQNMVANPGLPLGGVQAFNPEVGGIPPEMRL